MPVWLWPNVLSLDAPLIASAWQNLFAHDAEVKLSVASRLALPLAVWMIYLVDRLLDTAAGATIPLTARHEFSRVHRMWCFGLALTAASGGAVSLFYLPETVLHNGLAVLSLVMIYLLLVHSLGGPVRRWLPKEAAVGLIFAGGAIVAPLTWTSHPNGLLLPALLFGVLCWANSAAIEVWEGGAVDALSGWVVYRFQILAALICLLCLVGGFCFPREQSWWALCLAAFGYCAVEYLRPVLKGDLLRVSIDIPLLAPLLLLGLR